MTSRRAILALVALLALAGLGGALAQPPAVQAQGGPIFTDNYVLEAGQTIEGDLFVVAQSVTLDESSHVTGSAVLLSDSITVLGTVDGSLSALGNHVVLGPDAAIGSNVTVCADTVFQRGAAIGGDFNRNCEQLGGLVGDALPAAFDPSRWEWGGVSLRDFVRDRFGTPPLEAINDVPAQDRLAANFGVALFLAAVAALVTLMIPYRLRRVSDALLSAPISTTVIGITSLVSAGAVSGLWLISLVLILPLCLLPLIGLGWIALALMFVVGWTALSLPAGAWLLAHLNVRRISPVAAASVGAFLLAFGSGLLAISPWTTLLYLIVILFVGSWGLGAVVMTRFGGQRYPNPTRPVRPRPQTDVESPASAR